MTTQFGKIKLDIFSRKSIRKEKKKKRELPSQGRELIDKKTQHTCVSLHTHTHEMASRALPRIYKTNILNSVIIMNQH